MFLCSVVFPRKDCTMKFEELSPEQIERAKKCETLEERMAFIADEGIELTDEQMDSIAAGKKKRSGCDAGFHNWERTGKTRPGSVWGDIWPDHEVRCTECGKVEWDY